MKVEDRYDNTKRKYDYKFNRLGLRGGYRFGSYFGAEVEASFGLGDDKKVYLREVSDTVDLTIKNKYQIGVYLVGFFPVNESVDILGRVGYIKSDLKLKLSDETYNLSLKGKQNLDTFSFGAGAQFNLTEDFSFRFDYTYYKKDKKYAQASKTEFTDNEFSLYFIYNF